jgi:hypothetical protein
MEDWRASRILDCNSLVPYIPCMLAVPQMFTQVRGQSYDDP